MEKSKVSIITAVYKAEEFLKRCVDSILNQTYQNIELLLIDDGSPDNCPKLCDEYAQKDARIKVVHKPNGGVSSAWNAGLDNATGDYIAFVDSDDYVEPNYIEVLYQTLKRHNADIAICRNDEVFEDVIKKSSHNESLVGFYPAEESLKAFFSKQRWRHSVWGKLYKKEIFNDIRYPENIKCVEDVYMICDLCKKIKNGIATTDAVLYHYVIQDKSVTRTVSEKRFDAFRARRHVLECLNPEKYDIYIYAVVDLFYDYKANYCLFKQGKRNDLIKQLNVWFKEDYRKYAKFLSGKKRIKYFLFRYFRFLCDIVFLIEK